jgi:phospho-N-acetylmuramoyl-pentapeptide-transferase
MTMTRGQTILLICLVASALLTALITWLLSISAAGGSVIREQGPEHHKAKASTPSTGGRAFLISLAVIGFPGAILLTDPRGVIGIAAGLLTGLIGLADDQLKLTKKDTSGLKARYKLPLQILVGLLAVVAVYLLLPDSTVRVPFIPVPVDIGWWKIPLGLFCYLAIVNGVNFTDGLDGLATSTVLIASVFLGASIWLSGTDGSAIVPIILLGLCAGFIRWNWNPAKIFMGDSGSLAISGALAAAAIATGLEIILLIIGLVFIIEETTVVLQVVYFRLTGGKRIFRMTPIHHAWELRGYREPAIVAGASVLGIVSGAIGLWSVVHGR